MDTVIWTPLNSSGWNEELETNVGWIDKRIELMNNLVIPSVSKQTDKNFVWFIEVREDTVDYISSRLKLQNSNGVIIKRPPGLGPKKAWVRQPEDIEKYVKTKNYYEIRLNSDDLLHNNYLNEIKNININNTEVIIPNKGYYWYKQENIVVELDHRSPPFYALIYNKKKFLDGFRYVLKGGHMGAIKLKHKIVDKRIWCWIIHDTNNKIIRKGVDNAYASYDNFTRVDNTILQNFM